ncbi:MAG: class I SAM-dependent methyltransferase [Candidatus Paceibacterota bacterium]
MKKKLLCMFIFFLQNINSANLPFPYNTITLLPFDPASHFGPRQENGLKYIITKYKPNIVIEIGSYLGASTRFIANLLPRDGKVYAVDHWLGNNEWTEDPNFQEKQSLFYKKFLSNIIHANLCHKVIPIKMDSLTAAKKINCQPDVIFIDGAHDYKSVYADLCAWYPFISEKGILCGDDYYWGSSNPVKQAVDQFAREHNLVVKLIDNWFWYYERN